MMKKYKNKYRTASIRLQTWDYGTNAAYFITICTKNRNHYFGKVIDGVMQLSEIGQVAQSCWDQIPEHFPFVVIDAFVVMPDHVHGIIIINKPIETQDLASPLEQDLASPQKSRNKFGPQSKNLGSIIRGYKVGVKKYATINDIDFAWQSLYYDHIIRSQRAHRTIAAYIQNNPKEWKGSS